MPQTDKLPFFTGTQINDYIVIVDVNYLTVIVVISVKNIIGKLQVGKDVRLVTVT